MTRIRLPALAAGACFALSAWQGCVLREETITVGRDGSVRFELEISGSEEELTSGDAMPSAKSGWDVKRRVEQEDGEEKIILTTTRQFAPGEKLPRTFAAPDDPDADLYLDFPTEVRIEERLDGRYFFFRRVYTPRRWAYTQYWQGVFFDDEIEELGGKPVSELTRVERRKIIQAFAGVMAHQQLEFAKAALAECAPDLPAEFRLMAREALLGVYKEDNLLGTDSEQRPAHDNLDGIIERCDSLGEDERDACFDGVGARLLDNARSAFVDSLRHDAGLSARAIALFDQAYERATRFYDITDALGGQHFTTIVALPGTIVAHNGDDVEVNEETGMSAVKWEFDGKGFRDRRHELIAVSRLEEDLDSATGRPVDDGNR